MFKFILLSLLTLTVSAYDEQREIELIHGIVKDSRFTKEFESLLEVWSSKYKIKKPNLTIIETTPSRFQGYYLDSHIYVYYSENESASDIKATIAHELGHHFISQKELKMSDKEQELKADKIAAELIGKFPVTRSLMKRSLYHKNDKHPTINQRVSSIYKNKWFFK